jgi:hypothetical protein
MSVAREYDDPDLEELRLQARLERQRRAAGCRCGNYALPGRCPGPQHCPMIEPEPTYQQRNT